MGKVLVRGRESEKDEDGEEEGGFFGRGLWFFGRGLMLIWWWGGLFEVGPLLSSMVGIDSLLKKRKEWEFKRFNHELFIFI